MEARVRARGDATEHKPTRRTADRHAGDKGRQHRSSSTGVCEFY